MCSDLGFVEKERLVWAEKTPDETKGGLERSRSMAAATASLLSAR